MLHVTFLTLLRALEVNFDLRHVNHIRYYYYYYYLPAFYGFILQSDVDRINAVFRKAKRWVL